MPALCFLEPGTLTGADDVGFGLGKNHETKNHDSNNPLFCWITDLSSEDEDGTLILRVSDMAVLNVTEPELAHVGEGLLHCHCMDGHCRSDFDIQG